MRFKGFVLALFVLGSQAVLAGTIGAQCDRINIVTPCEDSAWAFGGRALYLQAAYSDVEWASPRTVTDATGANRQTIGIVPGYGWGFFLEGAYHFDHGKDFNLNYYHLDNAYTTTNTLAQGGSIGSRLEPKWDAVNFEFGQQYDVSDTNNMRIFGGVQFARIVTNSSFSGFIVSPNVLVNIRTAGVLSGQSRLSFNGFGPRVGVDLGHNTPFAWFKARIYGNAGVGLLAGTSKSGVSINTLGSLYTSTNQVAPELDLKLGLNLMREVYKGDLTLDAGWMWTDYLSVLRESTTGNGDVSFQGLYFGLKWQGNVI